MSRSDLTAVPIRAAQAALGIARKPLARPAKVGTQPWLIVLKGGCRPKVGRLLTFRRSGSGEKWIAGRVTKINSDGHLFIDL